MKILLVHSLFYPDEHGGAEVVVRTVSNELARRGISVVVASLTEGGGWKQSEMDEVRSVRVPLANVYWPFGRKVAGTILQRLAWHIVDAWNPVMSRRLAKLLDAEKPDLVNVHNLSGFSASVIRCINRRHIPVVATLHDYYFVCSNTAMFREDRNCADQCRSCRLITAARRRASCSVTSVVGVSQAVLAQVQAHGGFRGVRTYVNLNPASPARASRSVPFPERRDRPPGGPLRVGFLGRLAPTKGIETLIESIQFLTDLPVSASIAGSGAAAYEARLRIMAKDLPIEFLGRSDPDHLLCKVDVLAVPSRWREPMGLVVLEAWRAGIPVIGADTGGITELIGQTGAGWLFPAGDARRLSEILRDLVETGFPAAAWDAVCRAAAAQFGVSQHVDRLLRIYTEAIERCRSDAAARARASVPGDRTSRPGRRAASS